MLKPLVITALVAAFVLFAAMVGMIVFSSEQTESDDNTKPAIAEHSDSKDANAVIDKAAPNHANEAKKKREWYYTFIDHPTDWLLVLFNGLLVLATVALFVSGEKNIEVARRSANAAKESADVAKDTLVLTQRAFVRVSNFPWVWRPDTDRPGKVFYDISPIIENGGNTPTVGMTINVNSQLMDAEMPEDFTFPYTDATGTSLIGAHQTVAASRAIIHDDDLLKVQKGEKFFYIWGDITYRDVFKGTPIHTTEFCTQIILVLGDPLDPKDPNNPKGTSVEIRFRIHAKHNKTD